MSNSGEVPPVPTSKKPPSCWLIGGLGCLAVIVAIGVVVAFVTVKTFKSPRGKMLAHELDKVLKSASLIPDSATSMADIRGALVRYQLKKGDYPPNLSDLVPDYLPNKAELHSKLDPNTDPNHLSFTYIRPAANAAPATKVLSLSWSLIINVGDKKTLTQEVLSETVGGHMVLTQYQDGKEVGESEYDATQTDN